MTLAFRAVSLVRDGRFLLRDVTWTVGAGERWVVLGENGSGKTTMVRIASGYLHPTAGDVEILGHLVGRVDLRRLRERIGVASSSLHQMLRPDIDTVDVVMTAKHAALEAWWHTYDDADRARAVDLLEQLGIGQLAARPFGTLSSGEQQRVQLARTLMAAPDLLLLDEPTARLDLGGRERFVSGLAALAADPATPPTVLVTHHVDEIPPGFTHALLLRAGEVLAAGPIDDVLTAGALSACFGLTLRLEQRDGRWHAWAA